ERDDDVLLQIAAIARSNAEPAQEIAEDPIHVDVAEVDEVEPHSGTHVACAAETRVSEAVEHGPLLRIAENLVSRVDLFDLLLSPIVAWVSVWMKSLGQPPKGGFHLVRRCAALDTEDVVRVLHSAGVSIRWSRGPGARGA